MSLLQTQLSRIATYAYGSRFTEGTRGGKGNIGLFAGHVVKFNTHSFGRDRMETESMRQSCDSLRQKLDSLATSLLRDAGISLGDFKKEMSVIRKKLGLSADGMTIVSRGLLERKIVASVIRQIDARTGANSFRAAQTARYSSEGVDTRFDAVTADLRRMAAGNPADRPADAPVPPPRRENVFKTFDETIVRATEKNLANMHSGSVLKGAEALLRRNVPMLANGDKAWLGNLKATLERVGVAYGEVAKLTSDELAAAYAEPQPDTEKAKSVRHAVETAIDGYRSLAADCRWLIQQFGANANWRFAELANGYEARALELDALVGELRANGLDRPEDGGVSVATRLAERAVDRSRGTLVGLRSRLAALDRELSAVRENLAKGVFGVDGTIRLKHLEVDLHVAVEGLRYALVEARTSMKAGSHDDTTVLRALGAQLESMQRAIGEIRGETVDKLGAQLVQDHCPIYGEGTAVHNFFGEQNIKTILVGMLSANCVRLRRGESVEALAKRVSADLQVKLPTAVRGFSGAVKEYLGAKDAKSAAAALKLVESRAAALKSLALDNVTYKLLDYLSNGFLGSEKPEYAAIFPRFDRLDRVALMRAYMDLNVDGSPFPFNRILSADDPAHVDRLVARVKSFRDYRRTDFGTRAADDRVLNGLLSGLYDVGTYVGARVWQATPDMIDPSLQVKSLVSSRPLGSGMFSTTYLCTYRMPDGTERTYVFKPEQVGRDSVDEMLLMGFDAYRSDQQLAHLNFASAQVAHELGMSGKVPDVRVGMFKGSFGMFMDLAPGVSAHDLKHESRDADVTKRRTALFSFLGVGKDGKLSPGQMPNFANIGKFAHATSDLEWLDSVIGNGDRHSGNYHVDVDDKTASVTVTGIDNDTTFPPWHLGFGKYRLDSKRFAKSSLEAIRRDFTERWGRLKGADAVFSVDGEGEMVVDLYQVDGSTPEGKKARVWLATTLQKSFGFKRVARPNFISEATFGKLEKICCKTDAHGMLREASDADLTDYVMETYGAHLKDTDQVDAMVSRLKNAWQHAKYLKQAGRLMTEDGWGSPLCFDKIKADWNEEKGYGPESQNLFSCLLNRDVFAATDMPQNVLEASE